MVGSSEEVPHLVPLRGPIPLERAEPERLKEEIRAAVGSPIVRALLDAMDGGLLVLNRHRQIVAASLAGLVDDPTPPVQEVLGLRPGEALGCKFSDERPGGCGAADACRTCGALKAILVCQRNRAAVQGECLITAGGPPARSMELRLRATPVEIDGAPFTVLALRDASDEARRAALEQVFFHDLLNTLSSLSVWAQRLPRIPEHQFRGAAERVSLLVRRVEAEIRGERQLLMAERGTLEPGTEAVPVGALMRDVGRAFEDHPLASARALVIDAPPESVIETDRSLLVRVLSNMITNALEATPEGGRVRVRVETSPPGEPACCRFLVHNDAVIPRSVAARIFQRSFSTKARKGRGLGTYGMKLLGERYLGGSVGFTSRDGEGTTFTFQLPLQRARGR